MPLNSFVCFVALSGLFVTACSSAESVPNSAPARLSVAVSLYPLEELVREVGGDVVDIINLTPPGSEPHDLTITPKQADAVSDVDVIFHLGDDFQPAIAGLVKGLPSRVLVVNILLNLPSHIIKDPHFWLDPIAMSEASAEIRQVLEDLDPAHAEEFTTGWAKYDEDLRSLDAEIALGLASCKQKTIVAGHRAYGYLAKKYGFNLVAVNGISPENEPSAKDLEDIAAIVKATGTKFIFTESTLPNTLTESLASSVGVTTLVLNPIETLPADDLSQGASYLSVQRDNLAMLRKGLACSS